MFPKIRSKSGQICPLLVKNYIKNYLENLITILTIFSINLYTLEDKTMNQRANERELNASQFERLKELYVDTIVDSMSAKDLYEYVANDTYNFVDKLTYNEVIDEIKYTLDDEMLDEFVKQIKGE